jgi:hypothetical protein
MIGLSFLAVGLAWLAFSIWFALRLGRWLGIKTPSAQKAVAAVALPILLIGPFVDHIIGMRQFERLCDERTVMKISESANQVIRAKQLAMPTVELSGYWIKIKSSPIVYVDVDTNQEFLRYEILNTKGGVVGGLVRLGNSYQCLPKDYSPTNDLNIDRLLRQGK